MLIDSHCHLNFKAFNKDLPQVIERARKAGVTKVIIPGAKVDSSRKAVEIAQKYQSCYAAVGIHPHHVDKFTKLGKSAVEKKLREILRPDLIGAQNDTKVVAIGEIGLDYYQYRNHPPISDIDKKNQKELFLLLLELAQEFDLPVIIHCRNAHHDLLNLTKSYLSKEKLKGVFHCFSGEKKHLREILEMGFFVGFDGNITYPENSSLQELVKYTPLDKLLLETDAPFLTPIPHRGKRNEPSYLPLIASFVSKLYKEEIEKVEEITSNNALKLFNL